MICWRIIRNSYARHWYNAPLLALLCLLWLPLLEQIGTQVALGFVGLFVMQATLWDVQQRGTSPVYATLPIERRTLVNTICFHALWLDTLIFIPLTIVFNLLFSGRSSRVSPVSVTQVVSLLSVALVVKAVFFESNLARAFARRSIGKAQPRLGYALLVACLYFVLVPQSHWLQFTDSHRGWLCLPLAAAIAAVGTYRRLGRFFENKPALISSRASGSSSAFELSTTSTAFMFTVMSSMMLVFSSFISGRVPQNAAGTWIVNAFADPSSMIRFTQFVVFLAFLPGNQFQSGRAALRLMRSLPWSARSHSWFLLRIAAGAAAGFVFPMLVIAAVSGDWNVCLIFLLMGLMILNCVAVTIWLGLYLSKIGLYVAGILLCVLFAALTSGFEESSGHATHLSGFDFGFLATLLMLLLVGQSLGIAKALASSSFAYRGRTEA